MPTINLQDVPRALRTKLTAEAKREQVGISTLVNGILALHYGLDPGPPRAGGYRGGGRGDVTVLIVEVTDAVRAALRSDGPGRGGTIRGATLAILSERYGIKPPDSDRRSMKRGGRTK